MAHDRGDRRTRDAELTVKAAAGDRDAFDQLFRLWFTPVWNLACGVLRDEELAADVAQETFLVAWHNLGSLRDPGSFGGWVLRIGRNRALNRLRAERRSAPCEMEMVAAIGDRADQRVGGRLGGPADQAERRERQELVWAAAAVLGERDWLLLDLHLRHGLTPAELAGELGVEPNNCHQMLHRLRRRLGVVVGHYLLWQRPARACPTLEAIAAAHHHFDQAADRAVARHEARCSTCAAVVADLVRPEQLLATLPALVPAPEHLMATAADGIRAGQESSGGAQTSQPPDPGQVPDLSAPDGVPAGSDSSAQAGAPPRPGPRHRRRRQATLAVTAAIALAIPATALALAHGGDPPGTALVATAAPAPSTVPTSGPASSDPVPTADITGTDVTPATDPSATSADSAPTTATAGPVDPASVPVAPGPTAAIAPGPGAPAAPTAGPSASNPPAPTVRLPGSTSGSTGTTSTTRPTTTSSSTSTSRGTVIRRPAPGPDPTDPTPVPPPAAPPSVDARIAAGSGFCRTGSSWTVTWASDGTTSRLEVPGARPQTFDGDGGSGRATFCAPGGLTLRLTVTGDGGPTVVTPVLPT